MERDYWDACLFIEVLQRDNKERLEACDALLKKAQAGELVIVTSTLTIVEVNKLPETGQSRKILDFFENPYIAMRQLDRATAELAHEFTRTHGLANADAIHVATAILGKVRVLYTYDDPKKKRKGLIRHSMKIGTPPLKIERPPLPSFGPLFDDKPPAEPAEPTEKEEE